MIDLFEEIRNLYFFKKNKEKNHIKIYDCFLFFNENDLLEIRLNELKDVVDYFVILESNLTFSKNSKKFFFDEERFSEFKDKIIYIKNEEFVKSPNPWEVEKKQRNKLKDGIIDTLDNDLIILSDLDEIPKKSAVLSAFYNIYNTNNKYIRFVLRNYYYAFNNQSLKETTNKASICCRKKDIIEFQQLRTLQKADIEINNAGWHYSFMTSPENIIYKLQSYSHKEYNKWPNNDIDFVKKRINGGNSNFEHSEMTFKRIKLNRKNCPKYILKNIRNYDKLIFDYGKTTIWAQIMLFYNKKICQVKKYCLGTRNKSS